ncbi:dephospho-CoA kinase [Enemella sp. A6]|uniref:dephospho-CoA kinase n=1 Tax=Enemella sp. A6 TaxID=3440152 RepID=UPI003EBA5F67
MGLTGGIGSGKTAVADLLAEHGAVIIDADVLAREAVLPGTEALALIAERFGTEVLTENGELNRPALGEIVFSDPRALADLEAITHPAIRKLSEARAAEAGDDAVVVHVIPLLVESGQQGRFDAVVVVDVPEEVQEARVQARDGWTLEHVRARMAAQASRQERLAVADHVIDNSGDHDQLVSQVARLWHVLLPKSNGVQP